MSTCKAYLQVSSDAVLGSVPEQDFDRTVIAMVYQYSALLNCVARSITLQTAFRPTEEASEPKIFKSSAANFQERTRRGCFWDKREQDIKLFRIGSAKDCQCGRMTKRVDSSRITCARQRAIPDRPRWIQGVNLR
jgi:hypothetical protein